MKWLPVVISVVISACNSTANRPDQSNFTIHATRQQLQDFVDRLSQQLGVRADAYDLEGLGNDPSRMFRLDEATATLIISPEADDRCNPNAPRHWTFNEGEYRIDLVYRSTSESVRNSTRHKLMQAAHDQGLTVTPYREC